MASADVENLSVPTDPGFHYFPPSLAKRHGLTPFTYECVKGIQTSTDNASWQPDVKQYIARAHREWPVTGAQVPSGWPHSLESPLAWKGEIFSNSQVYVYNLARTELEEVEIALAKVKEIGLPLSEVGRDNFPLPSLGSTLQKLSIELHQGRGFFNIRGFQPSKYSSNENAIIYLGVSSYVAPRRGRLSPRGDMISHIIQAPKEYEPEKGLGPAFSSSAQPFHADVGADVLALYYLSTAARGGETVISSAWTVYNELARTRPEVLVELASGEWVHNTFGHYPPFYRRPLLFLADGKPILNFSRRVITGNASTPRDPCAPPVTNKQIDALDAVHFTAEKYSLKLDQFEGDMLFINNFALLHSRQAFEDDSNSRRHLLRLWLRNDELGWKIPQGLQLVWETLFEPVEEVEEKWNPDPVFPSPLNQLPRTSSCG